MNSNNIDRIEVYGYLVPKFVAYADDVACLTINARGIQLIFKEYERLSNSSRLVLNAHKTEILDRRSRIYKIKNRGCFRLVKRANNLYN